MIGPGYPRDTRSYFQSLTHSLTTRTILPAVIVGPEGILRTSFCPVASILMFVPPTSTTRTLGAFAARPFFLIVLLWFHERMVFAPPSASEFQKGSRMAHPCGFCKGGLPAMYSPMNYNSGILSSHLPPTSKQ